MQLVMVMLIRIYYYTLVGDKQTVICQKHDSSKTYTVTDEDSKPYYIESI